MERSWILDDIVFFRCLLGANIVRKSWFIVLLAVLCNAVPLAFMDIATGQWVEGARGAVVVDEHIKFAVFLFLGSLPVVWICLAMAQGRLAFQLPRGYLFPAGLLVLACLASSVHAVDLGRHWMTVWQVFILPLLLFLAIALQKWERHEAISLLMAMLPVGVLAAFTGLDQFFEWKQLGWGEQFPRYGLGSFFFSPNLAAEYLALLLPLSVACLVAGHRYRKVIGLLAGFLMLVFVILTKARAAWVGLLGGVVLTVLFVLVAAWLYRDSSNVRPFLRKVLIGMGGLAGGFLVLLVLTPYWARGKGDDLPGPTPPLQENRFIEEFQSIFHGQSNARLEIWSDSWRMCREKAGAFGLGAGQFRIRFPMFIDTSQALFNESIEGRKFKQTRRAHNDYIQLLAELGWVGLLAWLWLWGRVVAGGLHSVLCALRSGDWTNLFLLICLLATVLSLAVSMFFDFPSRMPSTIAIGWVCLGLLAGMEIRNRDRVNLEIKGDGQPLMVLFSIFVLFSCTSLSWRTIKGDFFRVQGLLANQQGDRENSIRFYEIALENVPWEETIWFHLYRLHRQDFKMEKALAIAQGHLERNPWYYPSMKNELDCLMQMGRWEDARASLERILKVFPHHPNAARLRVSVGVWDED